MYKQRLELDWIGKDDEPKLEPRILVNEFSVGDSKSENILIKGDNLLALKALEQDFSNSITCACIDPPYNTGSAFSHYDDGLEHSTWLSLMRDRLKIIYRLLSPKGSIWITIDDAEGHYLKVLCDEIFGRHNFLGTVTWQKTTSIHNNATAFSSATDMILSYAKDISVFKMGRIPRTERNLDDYANPDNDKRGPWTSSPLHVSLTSGQRGKQFAQTGKSSGLFPIVSPHGDNILPPKGRCWGYSEDTIRELNLNGLIWWGKDGRNQPRLKRFLKEGNEGIVPSTLWLASEVGHNQEAKAENAKLLPEQDQLFSTPKPERLIERILRLSTEPGDWVIDSFAGSGTTGAVAHKMGRKWIMVEIGAHAESHIVPRMTKVIEGKDSGGITAVTNWQGGGGFHFKTLAPSLLTKDSHGNWVISPKYNSLQLAQAVCKHEGFKFWPDPKLYWKQGYSSEKDFIFVTTEFLTAERLEKIASQLKPNESLLICAKAFKVTRTKYPNITLKKIPHMLLGRCEFGREDYSLNISESSLATLFSRESEVLKNE
ncbi:MAG: hypothetical protein RL189_1832 [Pseudomonadota bacterium]